MCDTPISADEPSQWVAVCSHARLIDEKIVCARIGATGLLIIADGGRVYACERACPHEQADLGLGRVKHGQLHCPRHLAWFDLQDGRISPGWCSRTLRLFPVRIANGEVHVEIGTDGAERAVTSPRSIGGRG
jgi:3-phenylpropionate/trans-cinnamate dioxygenase ferredoxin subunit